MSKVIEEALAIAADKFSALHATERGLRGVFRRLAEEHKEVAVLLKRAGLTHDLTKRAHLWMKVRAEMTAHERAEMREVYPDFEMHPALVDVVAVHDLEAAELMNLIARLDRTEMASAQWVLVLRAVEEIWSRHAEREEHQFFPRIQGVIGNGRSEQLELRYMSTKQALLTGEAILRA